VVQCVQDADPWPTFTQAVADLRGPYDPSHGQRQGEAIDKEDVIRGWANGSMLSAQSGWIEVGSRSSS